MRDRLLTETELDKVRRLDARRYGIKGINWHWHEPSIEIYLSAQDTKTHQIDCKEFGEWLPKFIQKIKKNMWADDWGIEHSVIYPDMLDKLIKHDIESLKKGEMPK